MRLAVFALFHAAFLGVTVLVVPVRGQVPATTGTMSEVSLPGGLRQALAVTGDKSSPDRAHFLAELIRRIYDTPVGPKADARDPMLQAILSQLRSAASSTDTIPLPLTPKIWIDVVFRKQARAETLVASILSSRDAALFYNALLSLDDETRAWIGEQPGLISDIVARRAAPFLIIAPGFRVSKGGVRVPGGAAAEPTWQALTGRRPAEATEFVRSLISADEGRLAFFFAAMAELNPPQVQVALSLDARDAGRRVEAGRSLYAVFGRLWIGRGLEQRAFVRPGFDPGLLVSELPLNADGSVTLPGTRGFWSAVFSETHQGAGKNTKQEASATSAADEPPDFAWLSQQVFKGDVSEHRRRFMTVLFASRHAAGLTKEAARDATDAVRAVAAYPALTATLERAGVSDLAVFAAAARRAATLTAISDESRAHRALAQYQGALAMITRAATRGTLTADAATKLVSSLSALTINERGEYEGQVVSWLGTWLTGDVRPGKSTSGPAADGLPDDVYESVRGPIEEDALRMVAGQRSLTPRMLDWEGTRYRIDFPYAAAVKLTASRGPSARPYLSSARTLVSVANALAAKGLTREVVQQQAEALAQISRTESAEGKEESAGDALAGHGDTITALQRAARSGDVVEAVRLVAPLRAVADDLAARGLTEWTYAAALGPRNGISITAAEASSRHNFGLRPPGSNRVWQLPAAGSDLVQGWHVVGSLLGLDLTLADFSLVSMSSKPPPRPTIAEIERRVFIETVALVEPRSLSDSDGDAIATAIRAGRARVKALRSSADVREISQAIELGGQQQTLLEWTIAHDPTRVEAFFAPTDLFWIGGGNTRLNDLDAWGMPAWPRIGCLCLRVLRGQSWERYVGRWNFGMMASAFPDLNFRIAELLSDLHMPTALLAPVLTSATLDFVNSANSRDHDDRRGPLEFVQALQPDRVEQYLALLTTGGPLVPVGDAPGAKDFPHISASSDSARHQR